MKKYNTRLRHGCRVPVKSRNYSEAADDIYDLFADPLLGFHGGRAAAEKFMKSLKLIAIETHVADARSCCLHPANATHRQMNDEELVACGITADLVRLSCGIEDAEDLIADVAQALEQI